VRALPRFVHVTIGSTVPVIGIALLLTLPR
jgi:hypothetical protein